MDRRKFIKAGIACLAVPPLIQAQEGAEEIRFIWNDLEGGDGFDDYRFKDFMKFHSEHHDYVFEIAYIDEGDYQVFCLLPQEAVDYINSIDRKLWDKFDFYPNETNLEIWLSIAGNCDLVIWDSNGFIYYFNDGKTEDIKEVYKYAYL